MNKMKSFVKEVVAIIKGDDAEATGQKILRQADSAMQTHLATFKGDIISLEDKVEEATENLKLARVNNGILIVDRNQYVRNLFNARNALVDAEDALEIHKEKIEFLTAQHVSLDS